MFSCIYYTTFNVFCKLFFLEKNIKRELKILHKIFLDAIIILARCGAVGSARGLGP